MKVRRLALILLFSPAFVSASNPAQSPDLHTALKQSLGFEDQTSAKLSEWISYPYDTVSAEEQVVHSGRWAVRLQRNAQSAGAFSVIGRRLPLNAYGSTIELRGYLRLENVSGYAGLWMREDAGGKRLLIDDMHSQDVRGTRDWAQYRITLPLNLRADTLTFGVLISGSGTLWADDLELLLDGKPIGGKDLPSDHEFDSGSHIAITSLTPVEVSNLVTLGRVWGFVKYHHPVITDGQRQWDYELFRILPTILAAPDRAHANDAILAWIQKLGPVPSCSPCVPEPRGELDLKPDIAWIHDNILLGVPLAQLLQSIYANRSGQQFFVASATPRPPSFVHEPSYKQIKFPDSGYQLLALFRWWNIIQFWAPYRSAAGQDWPPILAEFIPKLALAKDKNAYQLALLELIAKANDTHANLWSSLAVRPPVGDCALPAVFRFIDGLPVVYRSDSTLSELRPGDVINTLDDTLVSSLTAQWKAYYADSNDVARQRDFAAYFTRGACGPVSLGITRNGHSQRISAVRIKSETGVATHDLPGEAFRLLSPDVAYLKLSSVKTSDLPSYFERAKGTKGLIIDIRNYTSDFVPFSLGAYLATTPTGFVSFTFDDLANPGAFHFVPGDSIRPGPVHYGGKVVILVDETTQSQAEYTAMAFRAMPNAVVVGSTTAGADGNVSMIQLPGGLRTKISGLGVFYPDHRPTQRIGIVPDITVEPTVRGIAAGRDEVLEAAKRVIEEGR